MSGSSADLQAQVALLARELGEAREQQAASADVLRVISGSKFDLDEVLSTLIRAAIKLCDATRGVIWLRRGDQLLLAAQVNYPDEWVAFAKANPLTPAPDAVTTSGLAAFTGTVLNVEDVPNDPRFRALAAHRLGDYRAGLAVPLKRDGEVIGVISLSRPEARLFTDRQVALVETFADQAVIAIENTRLFEDVRSRNRELSESLEQQVTTSAILKVIASSPTDLRPVLTAVADNAARLCDAYDTTIFLKRDGVLAMVAHDGSIRVDFDHLPLARDYVTGRAVLDRSTIHVHDLSLAGDEYPEGQKMAISMGFRTILATPLMRKGKAIGALLIRRAEVRPFTDRQVDLLRTFADQAVIAIENVRLFEEVQARNRALTESLEQQTATGRILAVIASSPGDITPVLSAITETAARLCDAYDVVIRLKQDDTLVFGAHHGPIPFDPAPRLISRDWVIGRSVVDRTPIQVNDLSTAKAEFPEGSEMARRLGHRTNLAVPLLRGDEAIGAIAMRRTEVKPFSDAQISLLRTFADQAVIAIENVRLFKDLQARNQELSESLEQQLATSAILRAIAASPTDVQPVLNAVAESAARLCDAHDANIMLRRGDVVSVVAHHGAIPIDYDDLPIDREMVSGAAVLDRSPIHVHDMAVATEFPKSRTIALRLGVRTLLVTPLLREDEVIGVLMIRRTEVRPFSEEQIGLLKTFADQAAIAIENVRLFDEVQARNRALTESLEQQTASNEILRVISSSPTDVQPVFDTIAESAARLCEAQFCFVYRFDGSFLHFMAHHGLTPEVQGLMRRVFPRAPDRGSAGGRAVLSGRVEQIPDLFADADYSLGEMAKMINSGAVLGVPMLRSGVPIGAIAIDRASTGYFPDQQVKLLQTFADQAVIAIENVRLFDEVQARNRALTQSLEQQTAMSEILSVISKSPTDVQPVFETIAESAARLCQAKFSAVFRFDGEFIHFMAQHGMSPEGIELERRSFPAAPGPASTVSRAMLSGRIVQIPDVENDSNYALGELTKAIGVRSVISVPMLRDGRPVGAINIGRVEPGKFLDRQIELLKTFADQAVIAIENVRLFEEVQARNRALTELLEQQTATSGILQVISKSPTDVQPVFEAIAESAARLCNAQFCFVHSFDGELIHFKAHYGLSPKALEAVHRVHPLRLGRGTAAARAIAERSAVQISDMQADPDYAMPDLSEALRSRSTVAVPMLRDGIPIGSIALDRVEAGYFPERQVELLKTFADQAVIAIENVRLFDEVQARNRALGESLEQQTAMSEILSVISKSPTDVQPVFETIAESAARLCQARYCVVFRFDGELIHFMAHHGLSPEAVELQRGAFPSAPGQTSAVARAILGGRVEQIPDVEADETFALGLVTRTMGARGVVSVPMLRDGRPVGAINLARAEVGYFPERQIELLKTFADQAVIAIENVRLFDEVQTRTTELSETLKQQTATADVLKVISRSAFDLQTVLDTLAESAIRLCRADKGGIVRWLDGGPRYVSTFGYPESFRAYVDANPPAPGRGSAVGRVLSERRIVQIPDVLADPDYLDSAVAEAGGFRTVLAVPLFRESELIGVFVMTRVEVREFDRREIDLVTTFADQAVIAIENVRLFEEVQARTVEVTEALQQQTATADVLKVISRSAFDLDAVLQTLADSALRLCGGDIGGITMLDGGVLRFKAGAGQAPQLKAYEIAHPHPLTRGTFQGRAALEGKTIHVPDVLLDVEYERQEAAIIGGFRAVLSVPLKRGTEVIGVFGLAKRTVGPFAPRQIELVESFADQAVIAIENARLFEEVQARTVEVSEALQQQTATADVLKVISRSAFDLQAVLQTLVDSAVRLCGANMGAITMLEGDRLQFKAGSGQTPELRAYEMSHPHPLDRGTFQGRAAIERATIHVPDVRQDAEFQRQDVAKLGGFQACLAVPLRRGEEIIGAFGLARRTIGPFSPRQIELVETFADQAVIAIENVRLFEEVQAKTRDLEESLTFQKATNDVLEVIGRSASALEPVLTAIVDTASTLCRADMAVIRLLRDGSLHHAAASSGMDLRVADYARAHDTVPIDRSSIGGRVTLEGRTIHIEDAAADPEYTFFRNLPGAPVRTMLGVPLLREGTVVGAIILWRTSVDLFSERQIALVQTFADQAVIAIQNVRLFEEVQARTAELSEALQQQTATADVLKVISRSAFDLQTVLDTLLQSAARLCRADKGGIVRSLDGAFRYVASHGYTEKFRRYIAENPPPAGRGSVVGRVIEERRIVQIEDVRSDPDYVMTPASEAGDFRTALGVPLMRNDDFIGVFVLTRTEVRPFSASEIELVTTFADQAVIAIENVRLFEEVQHRTDELSRSLEDLRTAQDRLVQTEKLASLGQLTAGIAHEIKNPLNFVNNFSAVSTEILDELRNVVGRLSLAEEMKSEVDELSGMLRGNLEKVAHHGKRADSIVKNMLLHSRQGSGEHRPSDINAIVEESLNLAYHGARAEKKGFNITLEKSLDPAAGEVDLYPQEITRVLINLISNGFYATTKRNLEANGAPYEPMLSASTKNLGESVEIRIRDNGTGIPPDVKAKMFNPFFTTKPVGEGTGLGLSLSHDIVVKQHAGTIDVETEPGRFTEFRIVLPRGAASLGKSGGGA